MSRKKGRGVTVRVPAQRVTPDAPMRALTRESGRHLARTVEAVRDLMMWDQYATHSLQGILANPKYKGDKDEAVADAAEFADLMMTERASRAAGGGGEVC